MMKYVFNAKEIELFQIVSVSMIWCHFKQIYQIVKFVLLDIIMILMYLLVMLIRAPKMINVQVVLIIINFVLNVIIMNV